MEVGLRPITLRDFNVKYFLCLYNISSLQLHYCSIVLSFALVCYFYTLFSVKQSLLCANTSIFHDYILEVSVKSANPNNFGRPQVQISIMLTGSRMSTACLIERFSFNSLQSFPNTAFLSQYFSYILNFYFYLTPFVYKTMALDFVINCKLLWIIHLCEIMFLKSSYHHCILMWYRPYRIMYHIEKICAVGKICWTLCYY